MTDYLAHIRAVNSELRVIRMPGGQEETSPSESLCGVSVILGWIYVTLVLNRLWP